MVSINLPDMESGARLTAEMGFEQSSDPCIYTSTEDAVFDSLIFCWKQSLKRWVNY